MSKGSRRPEGALPLQQEVLASVRAVGSCARHFPLWPQPPLHKERDALATPSEPLQLSVCVSRRRVYMCPKLNPHPQRQDFDTKLPALISLLSFTSLWTAKILGCCYRGPADLGVCQPLR